MVTAHLRMFADRSSLEGCFASLSMTIIVIPNRDLSFIDHIHTIVKDKKAAQLKN